jgi:hypothetical protein
MAMLFAAVHESEIGLTDTTACLAKVRYAIISRRPPASGGRFNPIAASPKGWVNRLMARAWV